MRKGEIVPVLPFIGVVYAPTVPLSRLRELIESVFGTVTLVSDEVDFKESSYYAEEMGEDLHRVFFGFGMLVDPSAVVEMKERCIALEKDYSHNERRTINLDPGYVDLYKVVLLSEKYSGRKIHIRDGIYADLTLLYENGAFMPQPRAFPDFRARLHEPFFLKLRNCYRQLTLP